MRTFGTDEIVPPHENSCIEIRLPRSSAEG